MSPLARTALVSALLLSSATARVAAAAPTTPIVVSHQGRLLDSSDAPVNAETSLTFAIYAESDDLAGHAPAAPLWKATYKVTPSNGLYALTLGDPASGQPTLPSDLFADGNARWLGVAVNGGTELRPRLQLSASPFALYAAKAGDAATLAGHDLANLDDRWASKADTTAAFDAVHTSLAGVQQSVGSLQTSLGALAAAGGTLNATTNPVDFSQLKGVPGALLQPADETHDGYLRASDYAALAQTADAAHTGALKAADWALFSSKVGRVTAGSGLSASGTSDVQLSLAANVAAPLSGNGTQASPISIGAASASSDGYLKKSDWAAFNGKVASITAGTGLSVTGDPANPTISLSTGGSNPFRPARYVGGFVGEPGPDLSFEGWTQCYGWTNDGVNAPPALTAVRTACGSGTSLLFAGNRSLSSGGGANNLQGTLIRHAVELGQPFGNFLAASSGPTFNYTSFDLGRRYAFQLTNDWILLSRNGNAWSDPGRLWEVGISANAGAGAGAGHVLSQDGNDANDQVNFVGDRYFIYLRNPPANLSCKTIFDAGLAHGDGVYTVQPDGATSVNLYCDMANGGWTLVLNQVAGAPLANSVADVNAGAFGSLTQSYRVGLTTMKSIAPQAAWKLNDSQNTVFFKPTCQVDWNRQYGSGPVNECVTGYTSSSFTTVVNGGGMTTSTRGIGVNNTGSSCMLRAFQAYNDNAANGITLAAGAAYNCQGLTNDTIRLWYK